MSRDMLGRLPNIVKDRSIGNIHLGVVSIEI